MSKRLSRRDFLKVAQVSGAAGAALTATLASRHGAQATTKRSTCRMCTMHCGTIATVRGDRVLRVEGDRESQTRGFLCLNGHALPEVVHASDRLLSPMVRRNGQLTRTSWDDALAFTATRLHAIAERYGARALFVQTGWPFVRHPLIQLLLRFVHAFGSPNLATVASLCEASGRMGRALTCGSDYTPDLEQARTLVVWGANPTHAAPPFAHLVGGFGRTDGKHLIVVDPVRHELARAASIHLQVRPGTDGALALALIDTIVREKLYDEGFISEETDGFTELAIAAADYPAERTADICGISASAIRDAAHLMANQTPTAVWSGLGIEHHRHGLQTVRAVSCLEALVGAMADCALSFRVADARRTRDEPLPQLFQLATAEPVPPVAPDRPIGYDDYPIYTIYNRQAQGMLLPRAVLDDAPYPVRALILVGSNPLVTFPDAAVMQRVFEKLELIVTIDPFMSASARASHVVLPASTFAETRFAGAVIEPRGDSRPDARILFDLARALGLERYFPWRDLGEAMAARTKRWLHDPDRELYAIDDTGNFHTPSGRIELASPTLARFGYAAVPAYEPPGEPPNGDYPFILVTGPRTRPFINSQLRTIPSIRRTMADPRVRIHPDAAGPLGIADGDEVVVTTARGELRLPAELTDEVRADTLIIPHGWEHANANVLTDGAARDPISGFPVLRYAVCRVTRATATG